MCRVTDVMLVYIMTYMCVCVCRCVCVCVCTDACAAVLVFMTGRRAAARLRRDGDVYVWKRSARARLVKHSISVGGDGGMDSSMDSLGQLLMIFDYVDEMSFYFFSPSSSSSSSLLRDRSPIHLSRSSFRAYAYTHKHNIVNM